MFRAAKWITAGKEFTETLPSFQKQFTAKGEIKKATAYMTAYGVYDFFIDAQKVGNYLMAPGWTNYPKWIQYQTYDITHLLKNESTISVTLAPGWATGFIGFDRFKFETYPGPYPVNISSMVARFDIEYTDGTKQTFCTDETWDVFTTETLYCQLYDGQRVDYTKAPRFIGKAMVTEQPVPAIKAQIGEYIVERETISPVQLIITPKGEKVIDFGQNLAGFVQVRVKGKPGDVVAFSYGEVLDKDGNFYNANYRTAKNETTYILDGTERILKPSLTFQGFRYVRLDSFPDAIDLKNFCAVAIYSDMK